MKENENTEEEKKKEKVISKSKTFEMENYESKHSRQESFNSVDTMNESLNDTIILEDSLYSNNIFIRNFDYFMPIFLFANSFIYYSFINIIHLCLSFYLIYAKYSTIYNCYMRNKGCFSLLVLVIDVLYYIFKIIIDIVNKTKQQDILHDFFPNNWASIYEYVIVALIMLFLLIFLIAKDFSHSYFNHFDYNRNKIFLEGKLPNNNNILNSGIF